MQYLFDESSLNEEPRVRLYQRSGSGPVFGSSLELFAICDKDQEIVGKEEKSIRAPPAPCAADMARCNWMLLQLSNWRERRITAGCFVRKMNLESEFGVGECRILSCGWCKLVPLGEGAPVDGVIV